MIRCREDQDMTEYSDLYMDVAQAYLDINHNLNWVLETLKQLREILPEQEFELLVKLASCYDKLNDFDVSFAHYMDALKKTDAATPDLVLEIMKVCCKSSQPSKGLSLIDDFLPQVFDPRVRRWQPTNAYYASKIKAMDMEEENDEEESDVEEEDDLLPNESRILLFSQYVQLLSAANKSTSAIEVGIPIILASLQQPVEIFRRKRRKLTIHTDPKSPDGIRELGHTYLQFDRSSRAGIVTRVALVLLVAKTLGDQDYSDLVLVVATELAHTNHVAEAVQLISTASQLQKIADESILKKMRTRSIHIAVSSNRMDIAYDIVLAEIYNAY